MKNRERTPLQNLRRRSRDATTQAIAALLGKGSGQISRLERGLIRSPRPEFVRGYIAALKKLGVRTTIAEVERALKRTIMEADSKPRRHAA